MVYEIDQSGKVENTQKLTIVSYANGKTKTLSISAVQKRRLLIAMRIHDQPRKTFVFKIFAGLIFLLTKNEKTDVLIIDREYPGQEALIRNILVALFHKNNLKSPEISFQEIGKNSNAHKAAYEVFTNKRKPDMFVTAKDVFFLFCLKKQKPRP